MPTLSKRLSRLWLVVASAMLVVIVYRARVLPFMDDWGLATMDHTWTWVWAAHNEHRMVPTKLVLLLLDLLHVFSVPVAVGVNFAIYAAFCLVLVRRHQALLGERRVWLPWVVGLVLLSPMAWEIHVYAINSNITFSYVGLCMGALWWERATPLSLFGAGIALIFAIYASAAGVVGATVIVCVLLLASLLARRAVVGSLIVAMAVACAVAVWIAHMPGVHRSAGALPTSAEFWRFFFDLVAFSAGITTQSATVGAVFFCVMAAPLIAQVFRKKTPVVWTQLAIAAAMLSVFFVLAYGRALLDGGFAKVSRYAAPGFVWLWSSVVAWTAFDWPRSSDRVRAALASMLLAGYADNLDPYVYRVHQRRLDEGCQCLAERAQAGDTLNCPMIYPGALDSEVAEAKKRHLSFASVCGL